MKIDQIQIIPHILEPSAVLERGQVGPMDPTFSRISDRAFWSFCYLYCHFADTIPNSAQVHRYGPGFADSEDALQSNTSYRSSQGDGSLMI